MASATHAGFKIKSYRDGSLYRARVQKKDGSPVQANGHEGEHWDTSQCSDADSAMGQAQFAIDTGKVK